jgi:hypothetical protein
VILAVKRPSSIDRAANVRFSVAIAQSRLSPRGQHLPFGCVACSSERGIDSQLCGATAEGDF